MTSKELLYSQLEMLLDWIEGPARDMADKPMTFPTPAGGNHPTWNMGHLAYAERSMINMITGEANPHQDWAGSLGVGSTPTDNPDDYPPYEQLLQDFIDARHHTLAVLSAMTDEELQGPLKNPPPPHPNSPDISSCARVFSIMILHSAIHLGQLLDCRRALGRAPMAA